MRILYADGSALLSDRSGGWAWWVSDTLCDAGFVTPATNNTMELQAVIHGLEALEWDSPEVEVVSDSAYVINGMNDKWYVGWRRRGWRTASGEPVANQDLWQRLIEIAERWPNRIHWTHVRGHGRGANDLPAHVIGNGVVDRMAGAARKAGVAGRPTNAAVLRALGGTDIAPRRRRKLTLATLEGYTFVATPGGREYVAIRVDDQTIVLTERSS